MRLRVQLFSQLKEIAGTSDLLLDLPEGADISDLLGTVYRRCPGLKKWDANLLIGAGVEFVGRDYKLRPNDQIAIMPPVQGG